MNIFKAYDIRGKYPDEINEELSSKLGFAIAKFLGSNKVVIGRDIRKSAPSCTNALQDGILNVADVVNLGVVTTPMLHFAIDKFHLPAGVMVTASHNPPEYIGFKICKGKTPIYEKNGLKKIESMIKKLDLEKLDAKKAVVQEKNILNDYKKHILSFIKKRANLKVVVDTSNGSTGIFFNKIFENLPIKIIPLYFEPDGNFPNHDPNPLKDENIKSASKAVLENKADLGVVFDGDGDRCIFIDEKGKRIPSDIITILLAKEALDNYKNPTIVYDLRSSWIVKEEIEKLGGIPIRERVGHPFMKQTMRKYNAIVGGEVSGHYYFKENFFNDSGLVTYVKILNYIASEKRKISEIIEPFKKYYSTGEISFFVEDKDTLMSKVEKLFHNGKKDKLDGLTIEFDDWWFNLRKSNTEPLLRLNLEAKSKEVLEKSKKLLLNELGNPPQK